MAGRHKRYPHHRTDAADRQFRDYRADNLDMHEPQRNEDDMRWKMKERTAVHAMHAHPTIYASESSGKSILHNTFSASDYFHNFPHEKKRTMEEVRIKVRPVDRVHDDAHAGMAETMRSVGDTSAAWFPHRPKPGKLKQLVRRSSSGLGDEENLRLAFREIDNRNRGSITQKEMLWALRRCGINVKQGTLTTLLECMDKDPDDDISETDFVQFFGQLRSMQEKPAGMLSIVLAIVGKICTALCAVGLFIMILIFARLDESEDPELKSWLAVLITFSSVALGIVICVVVAGPALTLIWNFIADRCLRAYNYGSLMQVKATEYIQERQKTKVKKPVKKKAPVKIVSADKKKNKNAPIRSYRDTKQGQGASTRIVVQPPLMAPSVVQAPTRWDVTARSESPPNRDYEEDSPDQDRVMAMSPIGLEYLPAMDRESLHTGDMGYSPDTTFLRPD